MKKLLLAVMLYAAAFSVATAATSFPNGDAGARLGDPGPFGATIYVRGGFNDWGITNPMTYNAGTGEYVATFSIAAGTWDFKVASEDWATVDFGNIGGAPTIDTFPTTVDAGNTSFGNFVLEVASAGLYSFTLDVSNYVDNQGPYELTINQVPIPAAGLLMLTALGGLGFLRRR